MMDGGEDLDTAQHADNEAGGMRRHGGDLLLIHRQC